MVARTAGGREVAGSNPVAPSLIDEKDTGVRSVSFFTFLLSYLEVIGDALFLQMQILVLDILFVHIIRYISTARHKISPANICRPQNCLFNFLVGSQQKPQQAGL